MKATRTTLRLPSKSVQYGYVEVDVEHDGDWEELGQYYYGVVKGFQAGEAAAKSGTASAKLKAAVDPAEMMPVISDSDLYAALSDDAPEDVQRAASEYMMRELGATDITDVMNEDVEEETPEWEAPPPPPSDDDWDF